MGHGAVGVLWFAIFEQLFLILGVLHTLATDSIALNRTQISVFGAIAIVFAVFGVNDGIFSSDASLDAMGAGWLILSVVDILWVLYFTAEEDSLTLYLFNSLGTGGLTPPSRRRRTLTQSMHMGGNGYASGYGGGGIGSDMPYDTKVGGGVMGGMGGGIVNNRSQASLAAGSINGGTRSIGAGGPGSITGGPNANGVNYPNGTMSPLIGGGAAGVGAGGPKGLDSAVTSPDGYPYRARALYACELGSSLARVCGQC